MTTISLRSTSSENPRTERNIEDETAGEVPASAAPEPVLRVVPTYFGVQAILALVGEMDTSNNDTLREAVDHCLASQPEALSLDLSGLTYCGATSARALRWALQRAEADNVKFHLVAPPPWLRRVLTAIHAHDLLAATSDPA
jgi:anti-anti-sigma factor